MYSTQSEHGDCQLCQSSTTGEWLCIYITVVIICSHTLRVHIHTYIQALYIQELDGPAKEAGITLFNEIGLDPGIDHMLAMQCIDEVHDKGGKVRRI